MLKRYFVNQGLKEAQIEEFIRRKFPEGDYSRMELQRTPLGIKVVIYSSSPGRIIGKGGRTINEMTNALKERFKLENPQIDVKPIKNPDLDARIVAKQIVLALERGFNFKRVGNTMMKRIMDSGAIGAQIIIAGRISGGKGMTAKFIDGYLKHSGEPSRTLVDRGYEETYRLGKTEPGKVGVKVRIMKEFQLITGEKTTSLKKITRVREETPLEEPVEAPASEVQNIIPEVKQETAPRIEQPTDIKQETAEEKPKAKPKRKKAKKDDGEKA